LAWLCWYNGGQTNYIVNEDDDDDDDAFVYKQKCGDPLRLYDVRNVISFMSESVKEYRE
jgi:hypothetical protein